MEEKLSVKKAISELIGCTRRKRRPKSIVEVADMIEFLRKELRTYKAVAERVGLSTEMLREFRSVRFLDSEVRHLVEKRLIDSVDFVYRISKLNRKTQKAVAHKTLQGVLTGNDARVVKSSSGHQMSEKAALLRTIKSRDIKTYLIRFQMPKRKSMRKLRGDFSKIVGRREIISFTVENEIGTVEISYKGQKKVRDAAKRENKTLRKFMMSILGRESGRGKKI